MKAGYVQFTPQLNQVENNIKQLHQYIDNHINPDQVDLLVLPELALTGYSYPDKQSLGKVSSEKYNQLTADTARKIADQINGLVVIGYPEYSEDGFYNSSLLVKSDKVIGNYRKTHLFGFESEVYLPGNLGFNVFETRFGKIGMMICFDWFFPEAARTLALKGAQLIAHPTNLVMPYCQRAMFARSLENQVYTISANRCGRENWKGELVFTGESIIYSPKGEVLSQAPVTGEHHDFVEIDLQKASNKNINSVNHIFNNRRPEFYF
ncbi:MAG: nitrilase-related carbon-nitrogen hydrolase [Myxococcota bacterium]